MCQPISAGGRRCPIHHSATAAAVNFVVKETLLSKAQVEDLFVELRREGRRASLPGYASFRSWAATFSDDADTSEILNNITVEQANQLDAASRYALLQIRERSRERSANLGSKFEEVADRTGLTSQEVETKFKQIISDLATRQEEPAEPFTPTFLQEIRENNLPYDYKTVAALHELHSFSTTEQEKEIRVQRTPVSVNSTIETFGYDAGRLEITLASAPETVLSYRNVPEHVWERLSNARRPGRVYASQILGNNNYQYESAEAAEIDSYRYRCASCGQFAASAGHSCPERVLRKELAEDSKISTENIAAILSQHSQDISLLSEEVKEAPDTQETFDTDDDVLIETKVSLLEDDEVDADSLEHGEPSPSLLEKEPSTVETESEEPVSSEPEVSAEEVPVPLQEFAAQNFEETVTLPVSEDPADGYVPSEHEHYIDFSKGSHAPVFPSVETVNQLNPKSAEIEKIEFVSKTLFIRLNSELSEQDFEHYFNRFELSEAQKQLIRNAPPHIVFFPHKENDTMKLFSFDKRKADFTSYTSYSAQSFTYHAAVRKINFLPQNISEDVETFNAAKQKERTRFQDKLESGELVSVSTTANATRKYILDANLREQPRIKAPKVSELRAAIQEHKAVYIPIELEHDKGFQARDVGGRHLETYFDDQGVAISASNYTETNPTIIGYIVARKNAEGKVELLNSHRTLRCSCRKYRENYYCSHINHTQRHLGNMVQQALPVSTASSSERAGQGSVHRLMSAALRRRTDVEAVDAEGDTPERIRVTQANTLSSPGTRIVNNRYDNRASIQTHMQMPEELRNIDNPTPEQLMEIAEMRKLATNLYEVSVPNAMTSIRAAIRRSDVEIPVRLTFYERQNGARENHIVYGTVVGARQEDGNLAAIQTRSQQLQCTCDVYQRNYSCVHTRLASNQAPLYFAGEMRNAPSISLTDQLQANFLRHHEAIVRENHIRGYMDAAGVDRESAEAAIAQQEIERAEAERRRLEQRRIERDQREREWREQNRERLEREAREREEANRETVENNQTYRKAMVERWANAEPGYSDDQVKFFEDYKAVLKDKKESGEAVPFKSDNVTDGICADTPGARSFGLELEFDIKKGVNRNAALRKIGKELHEAGLTGDALQQPYHAAARNNYAKWSFENDCTVDAELVSPIMKDTPEHWSQLKEAIEIIKRNDGVVSTRTGSHVHISTASYESSNAKHIELLRTVNQNDDILYRMASSPERGKHRGMAWCAPNVSDANGDVSVEVADIHNILGREHSSHNVGLNFESTANTDYKKSHVEFRMWDGTLDVGSIQQQVALSAAVTDYAERKVMTEGVSRGENNAERLNVGSGRAREQEILKKAGTKTHTAETFAETNNHVAKFFDKIFRTAEARKDAMRLFAATKWQENSSRR